MKDMRASSNNYQSYTLQPYVLFKNKQYHLHIVYTEEELIENINYDPLPIKDLVDLSMSNWCHHSPHILKQGRTVWWNPEKEENIVDVS